MGFFFSESDRKKKLKTVPKTSNDPAFIRIYHDRRCAVCPLEKDRNELDHPNMAPTGSNRPEIYVLGEAPGQTEDVEGKQFIGKAGTYLRDAFSQVFSSSYIEKEIRFNNSVRCRPTDERGGNRKPIDIELECCRMSIIEDIQKTKPKVIIGTGNLPLKWMFGISSGIKELWRGRKIPVKLGTHTTWFFPILHPSWMMRQQKKDRKNEWDNVFERDIERVREFLGNYVDPEVVVDGYEDNIDLVLGLGTKDFDRIKGRLDELSKLPVITLDIENYPLKPYNNEGKLLSIAVGTETEIFVFPIDHPKAWQGNIRLRYRVRQLLGDFLLNSGTKICHNLKHELIWFNKLYGQDVLRKTEWGDTQAQGYILDERTSKERGGGMLGLGRLCLLHLGFNLKNLTDVDVTKILKAPLDDLLLYNGRDTKYTDKLFKVQKELIDQSPKLQRVYKHHVETAKTLALTESKGVPTSLDKIKEFDKKLTEELNPIEMKIKKLPEVTEYEKRGKVFNPGSNAQVAVIFRDILGLKSPKETKSKGYSTDDSVLQEFKKQGIKLAVLILKRRELTKLKSTYIDNIPKLVCDADGRLHTEFDAMYTSTGRLSSTKPNMQNFPKRAHKEVRSIVVAPQGHWLVAVDYGQIEARVIAMASKDKVFCEAIRNNYDVHKEWAIRIAKLHPKSAGVRRFDALDDEGLKKFRSKIKNTLVFPWFYGASKWSVAKALGLPDDIAERVYKDFWDMFKDVKKWQQWLKRFYEEHGYVETLTGRRRRAPLSYNELINSPVQGTATDIVVNAMNRLSLKAYELNKPQYQAVLNIHDDLSFIIPDKSLEVDVDFISRQMCQVPFEFINVPISIEVSIGIDWGNLEDMAVYNSKDFE